MSNQNLILFTKKNLLVFYGVDRIDKPRAYFNYEEKKAANKIIFKAQSSAKVNLKNSGKQAI